MLKEVLEGQIVLEQVLTKKTKLRFRINGGNTWYTTLVEGVAGDEVTIAFPEMFAAVDIILGDTLICRFDGESCEYSFEGEIDCIKIYFPQQIKLKAIGEIKRFENLRQSKREEAIFLANVILKDGEEVAHSCVRDISNTGLRIVSKHHINEGEEVGVHIVLPARNVFDSVVKLKGKVMWSKVMYNRNEYGIAITEMEEAHLSRLKHFIDTYGK